MEIGKKKKQIYIYYSKCLTQHMASSYTPDLKYDKSSTIENKNALTTCCFKVMFAVSIQSVCVRIEAIFIIVFQVLFCKNNNGHNLCTAYVSNWIDGNPYNSRSFFTSRSFCNRSFSPFPHADYLLFRTLVLYQQVNRLSNQNAVQKAWLFLLATFAGRSSIYCDVAAAPPPLAQVWYMRSVLRLRLTTFVSIKKFELKSCMI